MRPVLLALNAGSSTLKFRAYTPDGREELIVGLVDHINSPRCTLTLRSASGDIAHSRELDGGHALDGTLAALRELGLDVGAVVHRVVHGGGHYAGPVRLDATTRAALQDYVALAPLHQPVSLATIDALAAGHPELPQYACFDTAFHHGQPPLSTRFAIARHWHDDGIRRYGFHGLSYAAIARRLPELGLGNARVVVCHLGSGASACALRAGQSVASSTGFSAADGLMMGTRPGTLDAEVVLHWQEHYGMDIAAVRQELYKRSGLLGVSGLSSDLRVLLTSEAPEAAEAVELFCERVAQEVARLAAVMQGLDAVVFTAGIGEHSPVVRARVLGKLAWLGFALDEAANAAHGPRLTRADSPRQAWVLATDEEGEMAREVAELRRRE